MILYIRDAHGNDLVDAEFFVKQEDNRKFLELRVVICTRPYSEFLLANNQKSDAIIDAFAQIEELRGWLWGVYFARKQNTGSDEDYDAVLKELRAIFAKTTKKFKLSFVED